ncbi:transketolase [Streptomyces sp. ME19-01-6]|uniref:transketolase n=1 Tax=Streptomyces sp. ME19-01-6 TaxID=3028686 RepID=UPI0029A9DF4C|nr:transketolase [Streptomyces sp. ME19-01-6]MDX3227757.1 transketolase [Streptomyces sp. ME19-01-6]
MTQLSDPPSPILDPFDKGWIPDTLSLPAGSVLIDLSVPVERVLEQLGPVLGRYKERTVLVGYGASFDTAPQDVALFDSLPGWSLHVPGHPDEAGRLLREAAAGDVSAYIRLPEQGNAEPHGASGSFEVIRLGAGGVVLAVGPTLDTVARATAGLDLTVLYASTIRPFDAVGLRTAVLAADRADIVLVEPYLAGTSAHRVAETLVNVPHRLRALGLPSDLGPSADGLDEAGIAATVRAFLR